MSLKQKLSKQTWIIILSIGLLLLVNLQYFLEKLPGGVDFLVWLILAVIFLAFVLLFFVEIVRLAFFERTRTQVVSTVVLGVSLMLIVLFPMGVINFQHFEEQPLFVAQREGVANCTLTLKLYKENRFVVTSICFGSNDEEGTYKISGDSIHLYQDGVRFEAFALVEKDTASSSITGIAYKMRTDPKPMRMQIFKNELLK